MKLVLSKRRYLLSRNKLEQFRDHRNFLDGIYLIPAQNNKYQLDYYLTMLKSNEDTEYFFVRTVIFINNLSGW